LDKNVWVERGGKDITIFGRKKRNQRASYEEGN
jgi:hypothetical protein